MKKILLFSLFALSVLSCNHDNDPIPVDTSVWNDSVTATINEEPWTAEDITVTLINDSIFKIGLIRNDSNIDGYIHKGLSLQIKMIRKAKALQRLDSLQERPDNFITAPYAKLFVGQTDANGNFSNPSYDVSKSDSLNNWILITEERGNYAEMKGSFNLTLVKKKHTGNSISDLDTIRINNGKFTLKVK